MEAVRLNAIIKKDGEITLRGLPFKKGDRVEMILLPAGAATPQRVLTARRLRRSGLVGLWKKRSDIGDSTTFARQLREQAQHRWQSRSICHSIHSIRSITLPSHVYG